MLFQNLLFLGIFCQDGYPKLAELLDYSQNYQGKNEELLYFSWPLWRLHRCSSYIFASELWFVLIVQKNVTLQSTAGVLVYFINPWKILMCWKQWSFIHSTLNSLVLSSRIIQKLSWWAFLLCLFVPTCVSQRPNICFLQSLTCKIWFFFHLMEVLNLRSHGRTSIGLSHGRVQARESFQCVKIGQLFLPWLSSVSSNT